MASPKTGGGQPVHVCSMSVHAFSFICSIFQNLTLIRLMRRFCGLQTHSWQQKIGSKALDSMVCNLTPIPYAISVVCVPVVLSPSRPRRVFPCRPLTLSPSRPSFRYPTHILYTKCAHAIGARSLRHACWSLEILPFTEHHEHGVATCTAVRPRGSEG